MIEETHIIEEQEKPSSKVEDSRSTLVDVEEACSRIAPVWPLDQFIAVNPWWERINRTPQECAARLAALSGAQLLMPGSFFREKWEAGLIGQGDLRKACRETGVPFKEAVLFDHLDAPLPEQTMMLMTHAMDGWRDLRHNMSWVDEVTHQVSQLCGAWFDRGQSVWHLDNKRPLYLAWQRTVRHERGIALLMGAYGIQRLFDSLPSDPDSLIVEALEALKIPPALRVDYLEALLLSMNGWASWCAWLRWQDRLEGKEAPNDTIRDLLAIRLAWEWVLYRYAEEAGIPLDWEGIIQSWPDKSVGHREAQQAGWIWQRALELAYQERLAGDLSRPAPGTETAVQPLVHAFFCIDVRSEVFRRALEKEDPRIRTGGFAGFFGLPIAYRAAGADLGRAQLPGLLSPAYVVHDCGQGPDQACAAAVRRRERSTRGTLLERLKSSATSVFSYVEAAGLLYAGKLVKDGLWPRGRQPVAPGLTGREPDNLKPRLDSSVPPEERTLLAERILRGMSLTTGFPEFVLLIGHGSASDNNPHAAGLDCGACCGQTGEVNARAVAALLNEPGVRKGLRENGFNLPDTTHFLPGLHNTTTDEIELFDTDEVPAGREEGLARLGKWLRGAGETARQERAARLGMAGTPATRDLRRFRERSADWSQVRPEWGLANNASFIVAPRARTRHLNLEGRAFLHDYDWRKDEGFSILELIMTAPMLVTHWINMQYYASVVDNRRYGSGNKVLHNVVGGTIGVFEGNGGDLRIGLPMQSLHDGSRWMHEPLRLSVFIDAPREAIDAVIRTHETVRHLVDNGWIYLFQLDAGEYPVYRYKAGAWEVPGD